MAYVIDLVAGLLMALAVGIIYWLAMGSSISQALQFIPLVLTYTPLMTIHGVTQARHNLLFLAPAAAFLLMVVVLWFAGRRIQRRVLRVIVVAAGLWIWWLGVLAMFLLVGVDL